MFGHAFGDGAADAARRSGDDRRLAGKIEEGQGTASGALWTAPESNLSQRPGRCKTAFRNSSARSGHGLSFQAFRRVRAVPPLAFGLRSL
jgi:hypothetical protein